MILTAVNPSTKSKTFSNTTVFTTNPILIGLELNSGLYNERPSTNYCSFMAYFISTNLKNCHHMLFTRAKRYMCQVFKYMFCIWTWIILLKWMVLIVKLVVANYRTWKSLGLLSLPAKPCSVCVHSHLDGCVQLMSQECKKIFRGIAKLFIHI
jgi:hypothetical protein